MSNPVIEAAQRKTSLTLLEARLKKGSITREEYERLVASIKEAAAKGK